MRPRRPERLTFYMGVARIAGEDQVIVCPPAGEP
jgi:hypothetical protein